ncbi:protein kinase domain-containing protein [Paraliomyxa miuraensis]|uniref:serine/threonine-protein kinase n=1 Tax=Paraliomyxa miuraensis TaxID=376150 RepID=UPI00225BA615|nr:serine/threonine-protein kinase [Paraliomyxa miuraensis]MCX4246339.1 serine/threonine-protein kinase [Paraliomyxa miuraensis]
MECLDDATMANLAEDRLPPAVRAVAMAHVEQCPSCDERLQELLFGGDAATADVAVVAKVPIVDDIGELSGTRLGRYLIIDPVGKGALGIVYSAYDPELDRRIAIKVLRKGLSGGDRQRQENLRAEARSMARLSHPNVVPVFDVGIADERLFIAMELIDGWTLGEWARTEERSWKEIRDVYHLAGQGLVAAHEAGLIYRDFKPSNVMIGRDGRVRVLDFGIADAMAASVLPGSPSAGVSGGIGTPGYMAPEQYSSDATIDARADQYAFCVSLYEALYGTRPFGGRTVELVRSTTLAQEWSEPLRDPDAPLWLRGAIVRGLSLDPEQRWPDMPALLHALIKDRRSRRTQVMALLSAVATTAVVTSAIMLTVGSEPTSAERDRIEQLTIDARAAAARIAFVYPPIEEPQAPTAYGIVRELEGTEGDAAEPATERAGELREEFSDTLVRLGDGYYDKEGGRPFALEYYAEALIFAPNEHARARLPMTTGELASFRERAEEGSFSRAELQAAESLVALAEPDEELRNEKLTAIVSRHGPGALGTREHVARLLGLPDDRSTQRGTAVEALEEPVLDDEPTDGEPTDGEPTDGEPTDGEPVLDDDPVGEAPSGKTGSSRPSTSGDGGPTRDPAKAAAVAREARAAFSANRLEQAEKLYHHALELDSRNEDALTGLSELYFERGRYRKSLEFAKRAVARAPEQGKLRILLGDAHFKVLEYAEARRHYEKARALGHPSAAKRLEKLEKTVGQ